MSAFRLAAFRISASLLALSGMLLAVTGDHAPVRARELELVETAEGVSLAPVGWMEHLFAGLWTTEVVLAGILALLLIWRTGDRSDTRVLALFLVFLLLGDFDGPLRDLGVLGDLGAVNSAVEVLSGGIWWLALAAFLRFSALFPQPLTPADLQAAGLTRRRGWLLDAKAVWVSASLLGLVHGFALLMEPGADVPLLLVDGAILFALATVFLWTIVQGVRHLRIRYRTSGPGDRRRLLWVVQAFVLAMWAIFIGLAALLPVALARIVTAEPIPIVGASLIWPMLPMLAIAAAPLVITVCLAIAIFYDGGIDPGLVIRRTSLYGALGVVLTFLFAGVENLASSALGARLGVPEGWAPWIGAGIVALAFAFARDALSRRLGRIVTPVTPGRRPGDQTEPGGGAHHT